MSFNYLPYIREHMFPHIWCPGCGHGIILKGILRAIHRVGLDPDRTVVVSGIGCASRLPGYVNFDSLHTTHGRALAFATGVKLARPELNVIVVAGDGDAAAIGGNHFIHACRRNIDMTLVVFNNSIYGMTGGQFSPTTPPGDNTTTTPQGSLDPPFDISALAVGSGATFVARTTSYHAQQIESYIAKAIEHPGFAMVEVVDACYTTHGRRNRKRYADTVDMMKQQKERAVPIGEWEKLAPPEREGKFSIGILRQETRPEYTDLYRALMERIQARGKKAAVPVATGGNGSEGTPGGNGGGADRSRPEHSGTERADPAETRRPAGGEERPV